MPAPSIRNFSLSGFKSFAERQSIELAVPNGERNSGLTMIVGPNSGGKSAAIEGLQLASYAKELVIPKEMRHYATNKVAAFSVEWTDGGKVSLRSSDQDQAKVTVDNRHNLGKQHTPVMYLEVGRALPTEMQPDAVHWEEHVRAGAASAYLRTTMATDLASRLPLWREKKFKTFLRRILDFQFEQSTEGPNPVVNVQGHDHSPRGLGYGIGSIVHILTALCDAPAGRTVVIDEPELSLHPAYQRRLLDLFSELSAETQIVYTTHSPYLVSWEAITAGAVLARVARRHEGYSQIHTLQRESVVDISGLLTDLHNPHIFGTNATEVFFLQDQVILVEGQEDILCYRRIVEELGIDLVGDFFGWGVGGASNMPKVARLLADLGYERVVGILDGDQKDEVQKLSRSYPSYRFFSIPTDDVRDKKKREVSGKVGICNSKGELKDAHREEVGSMFAEINDWLLS